ncbi:FAD-dependent oxidoreductase [Spongisporangium articulatum]|uniref:D-amino-acid oxidase n=1 Tax=Spongisporangium articulatum TaxID=3362603 RepID=A0ABW8ATC6_9ACTN
MTRVTVVGAGVIGLTSAIRLAEAGYEVDVLARELPLETVSAVAGGLWMPYLAEPVESVARWARATLDVYLEQAETCGDDCGVTLRTGHILVRDQPAWSLGLGLEDRLGLVATSFPTAQHEHGWQLRAPLVDMSRYLPYLVSRLAAADGTLTRMALPALPTRGLVVNCTGMAARALASDPTMRPVRGQVLKLTNPGLDSWWTDETGDEPTYVFAHPGHVVVGGSAQPDDWSPDVDHALAERILARAVHLVPQLASATVIAHRVGLRPVRPTVRVEAVPGPEGLVVHNYGHGGSGVTLAWGCADDVLELVSQATAARGA